MDLQKLPSVFRDGTRQKVQTQIRLTLQEQSEQGLYCLQFCLPLLRALPGCSTFLLDLQNDYNTFLGCLKE